MVFRLCYFLGKTTRVQDNVVSPPLFGQIVKRLSSGEGVALKKSAVRSIRFDQEPDRSAERTPALLDKEWEMFACGLTRDQRDLTSLAHHYLRKTALKPRSLNF